MEVTSEQVSDINEDHTPENDNGVEDITSTEEGKSIEQDIYIDNDNDWPSSDLVDGSEINKPKEKQENDVSDSDTIPECDSDENIVIVMNENSKYNARVRADDSAYTNYCDQCDAVFRWPYQLKNHISVAHEGKYPYSCKECGKKFEHLKSFRDHKYVHSKDRPYACDLCPSRFKMRGALNKHVRDIHIDTKVHFKCEYCAKTFKCKEKLVNHFAVHDKEKQFACDICGKRFSRKTNLTEHRVIHSSEKNFECKECGLRFNRKYALKIHARNHLAVRPYKCDFCEKSFSQSHALKSHTRLHTGERPYKCKYCERSFKQLGTLQVHEKRHIGEKNFTCDICQRSFVIQRRLQEHIRVHTGEKPYECDLCPYRGATSTGLRYHKKTHERRLKRALAAQMNGKDSVKAILENGGKAIIENGGKAVLENGETVIPGLENGISSLNNGTLNVNNGTEAKKVKRKRKPRPKKNAKSVQNDPKDSTENNKLIDLSKVTVKTEPKDALEDNVGDSVKYSSDVNIKQEPNDNTEAGNGDCSVVQSSNPQKKKVTAAKKRVKTSSKAVQSKKPNKSLNEIIRSLNVMKNAPPKKKVGKKRKISEVQTTPKNIENVFVGSMSLCALKESYTTVRESRVFSDGVRRVVERKVKTSSLKQSKKRLKASMPDGPVLIDSDSEPDIKEKSNSFKTGGPNQNDSLNQKAYKNPDQSRNFYSDQGFYKRFDDQYYINIAQNRPNVPLGQTPIEKLFTDALLGGSNFQAPTLLNHNTAMMQSLANKGGSSLIDKAIENLANSITDAYYKDSQQGNRSATTVSSNQTRREFSLGETIEIDVDIDDEITNNIDIKKEATNDVSLDQHASDVNRDEVPELNEKLNSDFDLESIKVEQDQEKEGNEFYKDPDITEKLHGGINDQNNGFGITDVRSGPDDSNDKGGNGNIFNNVPGTTENINGNINDSNELNFGISDVRSGSDDSNDKVEDGNMLNNASDRENMNVNINDSDELNFGITDVRTESTDDSNDQVMVTNDAGTVSNDLDYSSYNLDQVFDNSTNESGQFESTDNSNDQVMVTNEAGTVSNDLDYSSYNLGEVFDNSTNESGQFDQDFIVVKNDISDSESDSNC